MGRVRFRTPAVPMIPLSEHEARVQREIEYTILTQRQLMAAYESVCKEMHRYKDALKLVAEESYDRMAAATARRALEPHPPPTRSRPAWKDELARLRIKDGPITG